jgi:hypothetical protein
MAGLQVQLQGFTPANRDAVITLTQEATGTVLQRQPFLDGSLLVRDLDPGYYQIKVTHPNLATPIESRRIRIFPQTPPTIVPINIPEDLFTNVPIADVPLANLSGPQSAIVATKTTLGSIDNKAPGEAIRATDWNRLVEAGSDIATALLDLSNLLSPRGHTHPEIVDKINQLQEALRTFSEAWGRSLLELRREIETEYLRRRILDVYAAGKATNDMMKAINDRLNELGTLTQSDTPAFTQKLAVLGTLVLTDVNTMAASQGDAFRNQDATKDLVAVVQNYFDAGTQIAPDAELQTYRRTTTAARGLKFSTTVNNIVRGAL